MFSEEMIVDQRVRVLTTVADRRKELRDKLRKLVQWLCTK
jgi:hypothetical protein